MKSLAPPEDGASYIYVAVEVSGIRSDSDSANPAGCVDAVAGRPAAALRGESAKEFSCIAGKVSLGIAHPVTADRIDAGRPVRIRRTGGRPAECPDGCSFSAVLQGL